MMKVIFGIALIWGAYFLWRKYSSPLQTEKKRLRETMEENRAVNIRSRTVDLEQTIDKKLDEIDQKENDYD